MLCKVLLTRKINFDSFQSILTIYFKFIEENRSISFYLKKRKSLKTNLIFKPSFASSSGQGTKLDVRGLLCRAISVLPPCRWGAGLSSLPGVVTLCVGLEVLSLPPGTRAALELGATGMKPLAGLKTFDCGLPCPECPLATS